MSTCDSELVLGGVEFTCDLPRDHEGPHISQDTGGGASGGGEEGYQVSWPWPEPRDDSPDDLVIKELAARPETYKTGEPIRIEIDETGEPHLVKSGPEPK